MTTLAEVIAQIEAKGPAVLRCMDGKIIKPSQMQVWLAENDLYPELLAIEFAKIEVERWTSGSRSVFADNVTGLWARTNIKGTREECRKYKEMENEH